MKKRAEIGAGMLYAEKGMMIKCLSRKESSNPKMTAKITIGKMYEIISIRFIATTWSEALAFKYPSLWGYVTVATDNGLMRDYPVRRFSSEDGLKRESSGELVIICQRCYKRSFYTPPEPKPYTALRCQPCAEEYAKQQPKSSFASLRAMLLQKEKPIIDPRPRPLGSRKISL